VQNPGFNQAVFDWGFCLPIFSVGPLALQRGERPMLRDAVEFLRDRGGVAMRLKGIPIFYWGDQNRSPPIAWLLLISQSQLVVTLKSIGFLRKGGDFSPLFFYYCFKYTNSFF
jgi:hypothetical protein